MEQIMMARLQSIISVVFGASLICTIPLFAADLNELERNFGQPPDDSRIMMRWWWFGPSVNKAELEREMKVMKEGGIGGIEVQTTYPIVLDDEKPGVKNFKFLSQEHLDAIRFTAEKAKELGMRMDLTLGSGWPYGGPQFPISEAAGRLRTVKDDNTEGQTSIALPKIGEGEKVFAAYVGPMQNIKPGDNPYKEVEIRDSAAQIPDDLKGQKQITFFIASQTKMKVKRAAFGAEGYVIDHYSPEVIDKFIKEIAEPAVKACGQNPPYAVFCDSLESAGEDWTYNFLDEFQRRRGYDLKPYLPALFNDIGPKTMDIRYDWGKTLTEIFNDYFVSVFEKWSKQNGTKFRIQAYGTPPATLYSYAFADLDEGEGYTWKGFRETRWASSASHLLGRQITSSETWTWLHSPVFRSTPLDVKAEADLHFLQGVNQMIGHGWPYSPPEVGYPGWRFYASMVFGESNPWWIVMPDLSKYLQRVSYIMRQGQPANDVALYMAESDIWANFTPGKVAMNTAISKRLGKVVMRQILESGYNLDFFDDGLLDMRGKVEGGALVFGDVKYKVVVLVGVERIPPSTIRKLEEFAKGGGIVIATRRIPSLAPGFKATDEDQKTVRETAEHLFKDPGAPGIFLESDSGLGEALAKRLPPDVKVEPAAPKIGFVHRSTGSGEIYFVANTDNTPKNVKATFRVQAMSPEEWDPMTGRAVAIPIAKSDDNGVSVNLDLEPYSSQIIVFTQRALPTQKTTAIAASSPQVIDLSHGWEVTFGKDKKPVMMDNLASWTDDESTRYFSGVAVYNKKITVPADMLMEGLAVQIVFGGQSKPNTQAEGEKQEMPADIYEPPGQQADTAAGMRAPTKPGPRMQAVFNAPVRDAAVVYINGKRAGSVWCPPYRLDITGLLRSGDNEIRIGVANLAVNYMADFKNHPLPDYKALNDRFGERFQPQNMDQIRPDPSGLLGPITIVAEKAK
jgi:hypothetical protein